jgi:hypothetical protein
MTKLRNLFLATAFAASLPAMAAPPTPVVIDFEMTATPMVQDLDGNLVPGTGDGQSIGSFYTAAYGVTFDSKAFSFYSVLNSKSYYGKNVDNLPLLPGTSTNEVFMAPYQVAPDCFESASCPAALASITTVATFTKPYGAVEFSYSADTGSDGQVAFKLISSTGVLDPIAKTVPLSAATRFSDTCEPTSSMWWCQWNSVSYTAPTGWTIQSMEFKGRETAIFYDNIVLTPTPEPSTYAMTLLGLIGLRFLAVRRRRPD